MRRLTLDEAVIELVDDGRLLDVAALLTRFARLETNDVFGIFTRGQLQLLMLLFRALGGDPSRAQDWSFLKFRTPLRSSHRDQGEALIADVRTAAPE